MEEVTSDLGGFLKGNHREEDHGRSSSLLTSTGVGNCRLCLANASNSDYIILPYTMA